MKVAVINGPNLNLLGKREPSIYGSSDFKNFFDSLSSEFNDVNLDYFQSNSEGKLIDKLHEVGFNYDGIIFNGGGYTHTSIALSDAIAAIKTPVIEVHISNLYARENFRHQSITGKNCVGIISGLHFEGYKLALLYFLNNN